jgi:hypothetical protein
MVQRASCLLTWFLHGAVGILPVDLVSPWCSGHPAHCEAATARAGSPRHQGQRLPHGVMPFLVRLTTVGGGLHPPEWRRRDRSTGGSESRPYDQAFTRQGGEPEQRRNGPRGAAAGRGSPKRAWRSQAPLKRSRDASGREATGGRQAPLPWAPERPSHRCAPSRTPKGPRIPCHSEHETSRTGGRAGDI